MGIQTQPMFDGCKTMYSEIKKVTYWAFGRVSQHLFWLLAMFYRQEFISCYVISLVKHLFKTFNLYKTVKKLYIKFIKKFINKIFLLTTTGTIQYTILIQIFLQCMWKKHTISIFKYHFMHKKYIKYIQILSKHWLQLYLLLIFCHIYIWIKIKDVRCLTCGLYSDLFGFVNNIFYVLLFNSVLIFSGRSIHHLFCIYFITLI